MSPWPVPRAPWPVARALRIVNCALLPRSRLPAALSAPLRPRTQLLCLQSAGPSRPRMQHSRHRCCIPAPGTTAARSARCRIPPAPPSRNSSRIKQPPPPWGAREKSSSRLHGSQTDAGSRQNGLSGSGADLFAGSGMNAEALRRFQRAHLRPGIGQLPAAIEANRIAGLVQREGTGLLAVNAAKEKLQADTHHRVLHAGSASLTERLGLRSGSWSESGWGTAPSVPILQE